MASADVETHYYYASESTETTTTAVEQDKTAPLPGHVVEVDTWASLDENFAAARIPPEESVKQTDDSQQQQQQQQQKPSSSSPMVVAAAAAASLLDGSNEILPNEDKDDDTEWPLLKQLRYRRVNDKNRRGDDSTDSKLKAAVSRQMEENKSFDVMRFLHGVASGDPLQDSVIIWTKVTPPSNATHPQDTHSSFLVRYDVSLSAPEVDTRLPGSPPLSLGPILFSGVIMTGPEVDFTVKVDLKGLSPDTSYYYRFSVTSEVEEYVDVIDEETKERFNNNVLVTDNDNNDEKMVKSGRKMKVTRYVTVASPTGRTRTLPAKDDIKLEAINFAVVSCSNLPVGFFNAYAHIAARQEVDYVLHLGDYLYEYRNGEYGDGSDIDRIPVPDRELVTLADYRMRHAQYKEDPDLQALHRVKPWIVIWDDHEFVDNIAGGVGTVWDDDRMPSAMRAYFEYLPIRESTIRPKETTRTEPEPGITVMEEKPDLTPDRMETSPSIYRSFSFGPLLDLIMLDTRIHGRDESDVKDPQEVEREGRTILGTDQEVWLRDELRESKERGTLWRMIGNQVVFAPLDVWGLMINADAWDGYPANRRRILEFVRDANISDIIVLTGDIHASLSFDVPLDPWDATAYNETTGKGSLLVELVAPSVTSPSPLESINLGILNPFAEALLSATEGHLKFVDLSRRGYMIVQVAKEMVLGAVVESEHGSRRITRVETFPK
ncbi:hypothetical protein HDU76_007378 [Blyttiomyces sp. JEL0837]|nr:hypothetical protein HDU76_007378 [Blyttiomyces sp. JEL0837]